MRPRGPLYFSCSASAALLCFGSLCAQKLIPANPNNSRRRTRTTTRAHHPHAPAAPPAPLPSRTTAHRRAPHARAFPPPPPPLLPCSFSMAWHGKQAWQACMHGLICTDMHRRHAPPICTDIHRYAPPTCTADMDHGSGPVRTDGYCRHRRRGRRPYPPYPRTRLTHPPACLRGMNRRRKARWLRWLAG